MSENRELEFAKWCLTMAAAHGGADYKRVAAEVRCRYPELKDYKPQCGPM